MTVFVLATDRCSCYIPRCGIWDPIHPGACILHVNVL